MLSIADVLIEFPRPGAMPWVEVEPEPADPDLTADLIESAVAAAREEALAEAQAKAAEELEAVRAQGQAEQEQALAAARAEWAAAEGARLAEALEAGLAALEAGLAETLAEVMRPVLDSTLAGRVKAEVMSTIRALLTGSQGDLITVRGSADLLAGAREAFADNPMVVFVSDEGPDVSIEAGGTALTTRLEAWRTRLDATLEDLR